MLGRRGLPIRHVGIFLVIKLLEFRRGIRVKREVQFWAPWIHIYRIFELWRFKIQLDFWTFGARKMLLKKL